MLRSKEMEILVFAEKSNSVFAPILILTFKREENNREAFIFHYATKDLVKKKKLIHWHMRE